MSFAREFRRLIGLAEEKGLQEVAERKEREKEEEILFEGEPLPR